MKDYTPHYHARVLEGWSNDPNGMIWFNGKGHMFFQYYPHKPEWGTMHWGHFTTEDFIHWQKEETALIPDEEYEAVCGCCSGTAIEIDGKLYLIYTAAQPERQRQCVAVSEDGIHFTKLKENPVLVAEDLSPEVCTRDFRDPKIIKKGDWYYVLAGTRIIDPDNPIYFSGGSSDGDETVYGMHESVHGGSNRYLRKRIDISGGTKPNVSAEVLGGELEASGYGNIILFRTKDLKQWEYCGKLIYSEDGFENEFYELDGVYECPDIVEFQDRELVFSSPQNLPRLNDEFENLHSTLYLDGNLDYETGRLTVRSINEIDGGFDFYAPQVMNLPDGRKIMIAWKEMWDRSYPTRELGWVGTYTLPRELSYHDGHLYQTPVREIEKYQTNEVTMENISVSNGSKKPDGISGTCIRIDAVFANVDAKSYGIKVFCGTDHETVISYDVSKSAVIFDRTKSGEEIKGREGNVNIRTTVIDDEGDLKLSLFLDQSSLEVFVNDGRYVMSGNVFPDSEDRGVEIFATSGTVLLKSIKKYDIEV